MKWMTNISLTVGIPNYNNGKYLVQCVESIINQTYPVEKIIIVDDKSTDNSRSVIEKLKEKYSVIFPIYLDKNGGVSNARNTVINLCSTEYITFIDPDDYYYDTHKLENEMNVIMSYLPKQVIAYSYTRNVDVDGNELLGKWASHVCVDGNVFLEYMRGRKRVELARDYCAPVDVIKQVGGYNPQQSFYEDLDLLLRLSLCLEFYCTKEYGTAHRIVKDGLSNKPSHVHVQTKKKIRKQYLQKTSLIKQAYLLLYWMIVDLYRKLKT